MSTTGSTTVPPAAATSAPVRLPGPPCEKWVVPWSSSPRMMAIGMIQKIRSAVDSRSSGRSG